MTISDSIRTLQEGNKRFLNQDVTQSHSANQDLRKKWKDSQKPHTMVLACADSRVPVEKVFDAQIGELFVVRTAGNVADTQQIASLEYAGAVLGCQHLIVLGHSSCGAVVATVDRLKTKEDLPSEHLNAMADAIAPAVSSSEDISTCVEKNARFQLEQLKKQSQILANLVDGGKLQLHAAVYDLESGEVQFLKN